MKSRATLLSFSTHGSRPGQAAGRRQGRPASPCGSHTACPTSMPVSTHLSRVLRTRIYHIYRYILYTIYINIYTHISITYTRGPGGPWETAVLLTCTWAGTVLAMLLGTERSVLAETGVPQQRGKGLGLWAELGRPEGLHGQGWGDAGFQQSPGRSLTSLPPSCFLEGRVWLSPPLAVLLPNGQTEGPEGLGRMAALGEGPW